MDLFRHGAIHEAGHAIVGLALGLEIDGVEIGRFTPAVQHGPDAFEAGLTYFVVPDNVIRKLGRPRELSLALLAGSIAEDEILGRSTSDGYTGDSDRVRSLWGWENVPDEERERVISEIKATLTTLEPEARQLVRQYRGAIVALATELFEIGRVERNRIEEIFAGNVEPE